MTRARGLSKKSIQISVHPSFYDKIEKQKKSFMKKHKLNRLSTTAFTGVLAKEVKDVKKKRRYK